VVRSPKPRLKVFQAQFGFYDTVVAASSQAGALRAWGTHQNLFANGGARITADAAAVAAALAHPETPLRRAVGSNEAFQLEPASLSKIPDAPKRAAKPQTKGVLSAAPRPPADRSKLDSAEAALRALDERWKQEEAGFRREAEALEMRRRVAQEAYMNARKAVTLPPTCPRS
jgi:hypothetical protein